MNKQNQINHTNGISFWSIWGKLSAVLAVIATLWGILSSIPKNDVKLNITAEYSDYFTYPVISESIYSVRKAQSEENIEIILMGLFTDSKVSEYDIKKSALKVSQNINAAWNYLDLINDYRYKSLLTIKIENNGTLSANGLVLNLPISGNYLIVDPSENQISGTFIKKISIGNINAKEKCSIYIWTMSSSLYEKHYFSYDLGAGEIEFPYKTYGLLAKINENRVVILIFILLIIGMVILIMIFIKDENILNIKKKQKQIGIHDNAGIEI
jgi:hypothetical protein